MTRFLVQIDDVLRRHPWVTQSGRARAALVWLMADILVFGMVYGGVMGTFGGVSGERTWQVAYSAVKVPWLLLATFLISLPSFFVLNTLLGLRRDFLQAVRALMAAQAGLAILLASFAPLTALWYASSADYSAAILFNALMFAGASFGAQGLLRLYYRPLVRRNRKHLGMLWTWLVIYAFVGIQMGWILRPFVGDPGGPVQLLREGKFTNAYEVVAWLIWQTLIR